MARHLLTFAGFLLLSLPIEAAEPLPIDTEVEFQPLASQIKRVIDALDSLGEPLPEADRNAVNQIIAAGPADKAVAALQQALDKHVLLAVDINPESRVKTRIASAKPELVQNGWRNFLVKVYNQAGVTAELKVGGPNSQPLYQRSTGKAEPEIKITPGDVPHRYLEAVMFGTQPLNKALSGLRVEYRILQLYSRDAGKREATLGFNVGQGTQDIGFRSEVSILFDIKPAVNVILSVKDHTGEPVMASFIFRDKAGRVYPAPRRRLAPDFFFHDQIYRQDGESVQLPPGEYNIEFTRGPEYVIDTKKISVPESGTHSEAFKLRRWIEPKEHGLVVGRPSRPRRRLRHYENPTQGVTPEDMFRHILGEDLNVGCVLSWGPCWYHQKQFFEGKDHKLSRDNYIMRYDIEVSGFPSSHAGHLCLLNLKEDDYPGTTRIEEWPSWDLPVLKWGKEQGGVVGFSHSGWGLQVKSHELPNFEIPPYDGIGANEYIVDVVHDVCDFISSVDTPAPWELNIWYHTLNCGFRCRISGETDFPCIYGQRVGLGRVYVKLKDKLNFTEWALGLKAGRSYVSDGLSHLIDLKVNELEIGEKESQLDLSEPGKVVVTAKVAALLKEEPGNDKARIRRMSLEQQPYWHIERARIGQTRNVPVEVVVNGYPVAKTEIAANGKLNDVRFEVPLEHSSWIALRVYPSSHSNPIFVHIGGKPIRALQALRRVVHEIGRSMLDQEKPADPRERKRSRQSGLRQSQGGVRQNRRRSSLMIESSKRCGESQPFFSSSFHSLLSLRT